MRRERQDLSVEQLRLGALAQNLRVESALLRVMDALAGIDFVVLKGSLLTRRIYGDLAGRVSGDNDVLIRAKDAPAALTRLEECGYRPAPFVQGLRALKRSGRLELWPAGDTSEVTLDLHIHAFDARLFEEDEEFLWSSVERVELHGRSVSVFDAPLSLAHLAGHTLSHFADREHLATLAAAWARFGSQIDPARLHEAVSRTLGSRAFEFSLLLALASDPETRLPWAPKPEARLAARFAVAAAWDRRSVPWRGVVTVLASSPRRVPGVLATALYPGIDELHARYGQGSLLRLLGRHLASRVGG